MDEIIPYGPRLLVKFNRPPEKTLGGLHIPQSAAARFQLTRGDECSTGTVMALGFGRKVEARMRSFGVKVGDTVLFRYHLPEIRAYQGLDYGEDLFFLHLDDVYAVLEDEDG